MRYALILIALAACKQAKEPAKAGEILAKSRALSAQICECKDKACAAPLLKQWNGLSEMLNGAEFSDEQAEGLTTEDERVTKCVDALTP